jgi:hypothetical protein
LTDERGVDLDRLEIAWGATLGLDSAAPELRRERRGGARAALEAAMLRALQHEPCAVAFSGGRDSSAVLALALHVARREGLPKPVALTQRFAGDDADESDWQERVIRHLQPVEWQRVQVEPDDADLVGPRARTVLARHGVMFPANAYLTTPLLEAMSGGALLSGVGGDEVLDSPAAGPLQVLALRRRPNRRDLRELTKVTARGRASAAMRSAVEDRAWLHPAARSEAASREAAVDAGYPMRWHHALRHWPTDRYYRAIRSTRALLAFDHAVVAVDPFLEPDALTALAAEGGFAGFPSRASALQLLVGDLLPMDILTRVTKASFGEAVFGPHFAAFRDQWRGDGIDTDLVDAKRLRETWRQPRPDFRSALLVHDVLRRTGAIDGV